MSLLNVAIVAVALALVVLLILMRWRRESADDRDPGVDGSPASRPSVAADAPGPMAPGASWPVTRTGAPNESPPAEPVGDAADATAWASWGVGNVPDPAAPREIAGEASVDTSALGEEPHTLDPDHVVHMGGSVGDGADPPPPPPQQHAHATDRPETGSSNHEEIAVSEPVANDVDAGLDISWGAWESFAKVEAEGDADVDLEPVDIPVLAAAEQAAGLTALDEAPAPVEDSPPDEPLDEHPLFALASPPGPEVAPGGSEPNPFDAHVVAPETPVQPGPVEVAPPAAPFEAAVPARDLAPERSDKVPVEPEQPLAWWDLDYAAQSAGTGGYFALGGYALFPGQPAIAGVSFRESVATAPAQDSPDAPALTIEVESSLNCEPGSVEVVWDEGFAPTREGCALRVRALGVGPFMASGSFTVGG